MSVRSAIAGTLAFAAQPAWAQEGTFRVYEQLPGIAMSLGLVVALIVIAAWLLRRSPLGAFARANGPLKIVATLPLGPKERLILVETGGARLLLGVAPAGIFTLNEPLAQGPKPAAVRQPASPRPPADLRELLQERS